MDGKATNRTVLSSETTNTAVLVRASVRQATEEGGSRDRIVGISVRSPFKTLSEILRLVAVAHEQRRESPLTSRSGLLRTTRPGPTRPPHVAPPSSPSPCPT